MAVLGSLTLATKLCTFSSEISLVFNIVMHCAPVIVSVWLGEDQSGRVGRCGPVSDVGLRTGKPTSIEQHLSHMSFYCHRMFSRELSLMLYLSHIPTCSSAF